VCCVVFVFVLCDLFGVLYSCCFVFALFCLFFKKYVYLCVVHVVVLCCSLFCLVLFCSSFVSYCCFLFIVFDEFYVVV